MLQVLVLQVLVLQVLVFTGTCVHELRLKMVAFSDSGTLKLTMTSTFVARVTVLSIKPHGASLAVSGAR